jgi:hypothetical protein
MKIIKQGVHDYYDVMISQYGYSTEGNTFDRTLTVINQIDPQSYILNRWDSTPTSPHTIRTDKRRFTCWFYNIIFCGVEYPLLHIKNDDISMFVRDIVDEHIYSYDEFIEFANTHNIVIDEKEKTYKWSYSVNVLSHEFLKKFFINNCNNRDNYIKDKIVIGLIKFSRYSTPPSVIINPVLKEYKFYKIMDPYTCYQELSMYVDGMLTYPGNLMVDIEDKYRIAAHGFDHKYAFRTPPSK